MSPFSRWETNNPVKSLAVPIGVGTDGKLFTLDLHEKYQGPHGLVAGMTGSGKSEFIITYILSLAVNFSPDEVAFVLIDYKGGGLGTKGGSNTAVQGSVDFSPFTQEEDDDVLADISRIFDRRKADGTEE